MPEKDLYEDLMRFYEFQLGRLPERQAFKAALQTTFTPQDLRVFFLLPFFGMVSKEKFEQKALKAGISLDDLRARVKRLQPEGVVDSYVDPKKGRIYGRSPIIALLEFQVRVKVDSPMRQVCTTVMNAFIEGATDAVPTKTPYYRVLPVEHTLTGKPAQQQVPVDQVIPDPRQVLPIDIISEMIKKEPLITVSDCYCRSTKRLVGQDCGHPMETCFYFNELAMLKLESGYSRQVTYDEAMHILMEAEKAGLVHNVSNCKGKIQTLCNCCSCSCGVLRATIRGATNTGAPSRYFAVIDRARCTLAGDCVKICPMGVYQVHDGKLSMNTARCIGCGLCVSACQQGALHLELRKKPRQIPADNDALNRQIYLEALFGLATKPLRTQK